MAAPGSPAEKKFLPNGGPSGGSALFVVPARGGGVGGEGGGKGDARDFCAPPGAPPPALVPFFLSSTTDDFFVYIATTQESDVSFGEVPCSPLSKADVQKPNSNTWPAVSPHRHAAAYGTALCRAGRGCGGRRAHCALPSVTTHNAM